MAEGVVDCMTCLVRRADGLPAPGTHVDHSGVVHATVRWMRKVVLACTLIQADLDGHLEWFVVDSSVCI